MVLLKPLQSHCDVLYIALRKLTVAVSSCYRFRGCPFQDPRSITRQAHEKSYVLANVGMIKFTSLFFADSVCYLTEQGRSTVVLGKTSSFEVRRSSPVWHRGAFKVPGMAGISFA